MSKKHESPVVEEPITEQVPVPVAAVDDAVRYSMTQVDNTENIATVVSPDETIEDAVRQYNIGRPKPFTAKQLIITRV